MDDIFRPEKSKLRIRALHDLIFIEGGSYLWVIFLALVIGIFLDLGFYTIPIDILFYKWLVMLFGGLLSVGVFTRIIKYEPEWEEEKKHRKRDFDKMCENFDKFDKSLSGYISHNENMEKILKDKLDNVRNTIYEFGNKYIGD